MLCLVVASVSMNRMLQIGTDTLSRSTLAYLAFRLAFQETLERIALAGQMGDEAPHGFGYLTEVPFLHAVPPHVQLDLLAETWSKHRAEEVLPATLLDESVLYAACETAARIVDEEPSLVPLYLRHGPAEVDVPVDRFLAWELRALHLNLSSEGDFLLLSQFEDMPPDEARRTKCKFQLDESRLEVMFEVLGRYHVRSSFLENLTGLVSEREITQAASTLQVRQTSE